MTISKFDWTKAYGQVYAGQRFSQDRYKVFALPKGVPTMATVDSGAVRFHTQSHSYKLPHIAEALKAYAENSRFISGPGLTSDGQKAFKSGLSILFSLIPARPQATSFNQFAARLVDKNGPVTRDEVSAVVLLALPLSVSLSGKDSTDFQMRNSHVQRVLESLNMTDPVLSPYPVLRPMFEVKGSPFTGFGYGGVQNNEYTWRQACFASQMYGGQGVVYGVNQYKGWAQGEPTFLQFMPEVLADFAENDYDI